MLTKVLFKEKQSGRINVKYGSLLSSAEFQDTLQVEVETVDENLALGAFPTIIHVLEVDKPFSFNLRDVSSDYPIFMPDFDAAVLPGHDKRNYSDIAKAIYAASLVGDFARMQQEEEESFENACSQNRNQYCPTWLGLGRDVRIFRVGPQRLTSGARTDFHYWGTVTPYLHSFAREILPDKVAP